MSGAARRKPDPKKHCLHCGMQMRRKRIDGRLEDNTSFARRRYCDRECMAKGMVKPEVTKGTYMWRARQLRGPSCETCGSTSKLHAHHVDENWRNNDPSNIQTLCATCHLKLHWSKRQHRTHIRTVDGDSLDGLLGLVEQSYDHLPAEMVEQMRAHVSGLWARPGERSSAGAGILVRLMELE